MQAGDVVAGLVGGDKLGLDLIEGQGAVSTRRAPAGQWARISAGTIEPA